MYRFYSKLNSKITVNLNGVLFSQMGKRRHADMGQFTSYAPFFWTFQRKKVVI
jgi:hypothetical protein